MAKIVNTAIAALALGGLAISAPVMAQYNQKITNDPAKCRGSNPSVLVTLTGIKSSSGTIRVQSYRGTKSDWLEKGRWLSRIQSKASAGTMTFCVPVPSSGTYAIAVRHDVNGNGSTDIFSDGGGMSNNPSINIFNLGKPSYNKTAFEVGNGAKNISIQMRYR